MSPGIIIASLWSADFSLLSLLRGGGASSIAALQDAIVPLATAPAGPDVNSRGRQPTVDRGRIFPALKGPNSLRPYLSSWFDPFRVAPDFPFLSVGLRCAATHGYSRPDPCGVRPAVAPFIAAAMGHSFQHRGAENAERGRESSSARSLCVLGVSALNFCLHSSPTTCHEGHFPLPDRHHAMHGTVHPFHGGSHALNQGVRPLSEYVSALDEGAPALHHHDHALDNRLSALDKHVPALDECVPALDRCVPALDECVSALHGRPLTTSIGTDSFHASSFPFHERLPLFHRVARQAHDHRSPIAGRPRRFKSPLRPTSAVIHP